MSLDSVQNKTINPSNILSQLLKWFSVQFRTNALIRDKIRVEARLVEETLVNRLQQSSTCESRSSPNEGFWNERKDLIPEIIGKSKL